MCLSYVILSTVLGLGLNSASHPQTLPKLRVEVGVMWFSIVPFDVNHSRDIPLENHSWCTSNCQVWILKEFSICRDSKV